MRSSSSTPGDRMDPSLTRDNFTGCKRVQQQGITAAISIAEDDGTDVAERDIWAADEMGAGAIAMGVRDPALRNLLSETSQPPYSGKHGHTSDRAAIGWEETGAALFWRPAGAD